MSGPLSVPGAKATLFLSLTMTMVGMTGLILSVHLLTMPLVPAASTGVDPSIAPAWDGLTRAIARSTIPEAVLTANILLSALLVIASFLLTARRATALWWTRQALVAKLLYVLGSAAAWFALSSAVRPELAAYHLAAMPEQGPEAPRPEEVLAMVPVMWGCLFVLLALFGLAFYFVLLRVSRREDVRAFVERRV